nr:bis(5'-nucleosyl)-tetraphosphatase (symmetrical) YqeK [Tissierella sp.]
MIEKIKQDLKQNISKDRYEHTLRVVNICKELAELYGEDLEKTKIAALLHDSAKFISKDKVFEMARDLNLLDDDIYLYNKEIIHASLGAALAKINYGIEDADILNSISYHTTGRAGMSLLEKIIFIGDYIEPSREFDGIQEIRDLAFKDLDASLLLALDTNLKFLLDRKKLISKDTIEARNYFMIENL